MKTPKITFPLLFLLMSGIGCQLPAQQFPVVLEAEDATLVGSGPVVSTNNDWPAGEKYVENIRANSSLIYNNVEIDKAGVYRFDIRYLTGDTDRPVAITVNSYDPVMAYFRETTQHWNSPPTKTATAYLHMDKGTNHITIAPTKSYGPNIDKFVINPADKMMNVDIYPYDLTDEAEISSSDDNSTLAYLTDNDYNTIYKVENKTSVIINVDCKNPVLLTGYLLSGGKNKNENISTWKLESSTDNKTWNSVSATSSNENDNSILFHVARNVANADNKTARYYRLTASGTNNVEVSELQLFGIPYSDGGKPFQTDMMTEVSPETHTNAMPDGNTGYTRINLFDRNITTKYYAQSAETFLITAETKQPKVLRYYTLTSCADAIDRDIKSWKVEGYNGYTWETVQQVKDFFFPCRLATMKFTVSSDKAYEAFRLRMDESNGSYNVQLLQWQLFGENSTITLRTQEKWSKKKPAITTPWYDTIDPDNVLGEYPRPQMVRDSWMNLNGIWDFKESMGMGRYRSNQSFDKQVLVPFPLESGLSGLMLTDHTERPYKTYLYQRTFVVPSAMTGKKILLHFGAVDWKCEVYVNGNAVGTHEGGYDPFSFDITQALKPDGEQEVQVQFMDPTDAGGQPVGKQKINFGGIFYTPSSGIWQTVWLESVNQSYINNFIITPDIDNNRVTFRAASNDFSETKIKVNIYDGDRLITNATGGINQDINITINNPKLWSPDSPFLYDAEVELTKDGITVDKVKTYFGMRKIHVGQVDGKACFMFNNEPLFQHGPLDQGYWPDGLHTAPSDEALIFDIEQTKALGFNMSRKHIKIEPARWYYHCDRLGLLVWQDMVNAGSDQNLMGDDNWVKSNFIRESRNVINSLKNHPSIVTWIVFNEGFGQYAANDSHTRNAYNAVRNTDKTRVISSASGWVIFDNIGQVADMHSYPRPGMFPNPQPNRVSVCGEYGGITLVVKNHVWKESDMEYVSVADGEGLKNLFISYTDLLQPLRSDGLGAAVYTQLTDLEGEVNGLITYDRKVVKVNAKQKEEVFKALQNSIYSTSQELVPTALRAKSTVWKYTEHTPDGSWNTPEFDDSTWSTGVSGFGDGNTPNTTYDNKSTVNTPWKSQNIYLRKEFNVGEITSEMRNKLRLTIYHDDDCEVYINGVLAFDAKGYTSHYTTFDVYPEAKAALRANSKNVIAIKCRQYTGGQYIDAGLMMEYAVGTPVGISAAQLTENPYYLYPNPTDGPVQIAGNCVEDIKGGVIYDLSGKMKKAFTTDIFNIKEFNEGIYLVQVLTANAMYPLKLLKK